jgi:hypothetical protein
MDEGFSAITTGIYTFEDQNMDIFQLIELRQTHDSHLFHLDNEKDYIKQLDEVDPNDRIKKWPSPIEFWASEEEKEFRIYFSYYAEARNSKG